MDSLRDILGVLVALAVVLGLAFLALKLMKRFQIGVGPAAGTSEDLRFLRALPVGPHERLVLASWRGEVLLLGVTAGGIALLDRRDASDPEPAGIGENPS